MGSQRVGHRDYSHAYQLNYWKIDSLSCCKLEWESRNLSLDGVEVVEISRSSCSSLSHSSKYKSHSLTWFLMPLLISWVSCHSLLCTLRFSISNFLQSSVLWMCLLSVASGHNLVTACSRKHVLNHRDWVRWVHVSQVQWPSKSLNIAHKRQKELTPDHHLYHHEVQRAISWWGIVWCFRLTYKEWLSRDHRNPFSLL